MTVHNIINFYINLLGIKMIIIQTKFKNTYLFFTLMLLSSLAIALEPTRMIPDIEAIEQPTLTEVFVNVGGVSGFIRFKTCDKCKELKFIVSEESRLDSQNGPLTSLAALKAWTGKKLEVVSHAKGSTTVHNIYVSSLEGQDQ